MLAHVTTQMEAIRQGANAGMIFQSIAGSEKGLREFGVTTGLLDEAYDLARHYCQATGPNVMYFETGQGSALSADAHYGCDQVTMEARLEEDLEADSLDAVELNMALEDELGTGIPDEELQNMKTVGDIVNYLEAHA